MQTAYMYDDSPLCAPQFTGKERDTETGLDYFGARYYGSTMGRFSSPDEFSGGPVDLFDPDDPASQALPYANIFNPQSFNKYSYTYNNPLRYTDPDGHCPICAAVGAVVGGGVSIVSQLVENPTQDVNWKQVGASALAGAIVGGTVGLAAAPATLTTIAGTVTLEAGSSTALAAGAAVGAGAASTVVEKSITTGSTEKALENPSDIFVKGPAAAVASEVGGRVAEKVVEKVAGGAVKALEGQMGRARTAARQEKVGGRLEGAQRKLETKKTAASAAVDGAVGVAATTNKDKKKENQ